MKTHIMIILLMLFSITLITPQNKNAVISELKNNEVSIKLHRLIDFNSSSVKSGYKFLVADITIENTSGKSIEMGAEYTMSITIKDANGNEYRSGLKGAGIVSSYLAKNGMTNRIKKHIIFALAITFLQKQKHDLYFVVLKFQKMLKLFPSVKKENMWSDLKIILDNL
jgi:hypothetical protein